MLESVGKRISYCRNKKGVSQRKMEIDCSLSQGSVNNYEQDKAFPSPAFFKVAPEYLECTEEFLKNGFPNESKYGLEALDLLSQTPGIDPILIDFVRDSLTHAAMRAEKYEELMKLVIKLKSEMTKLR